MFLPNVDERNIVVFKLWPSLPYNKRLLAGIGLIILGLLLQGITQSFWSGLIFLLAANLILLVSGYDNRVDFGRFDPEAKWERVDEKKLNDLSQLDQKMKKWDSSVLDVTSGFGAVIFVLLSVLLVFGVVVSYGAIRILFLDAIILLLPHWVTGIRRIFRLPKITIRIKVIQGLLTGIRNRLGDHRVDLMMLLTSSETPLPEDIKFKIDINGHHPDFLGLYGQVVINAVQGASYPYFYVVLVSKREFDLKKAYRSYNPPSGIVKEFKIQNEVNVMVIRQRTTKNSGYHTKIPAALRILGEGLALAEKAAVV